MRAVPTVLLDILGQDGVQDVQVDVYRRAFCRFLVPMDAQVVTFLNADYQMRGGRLSYKIGVVLMFIRLSYACFCEGAVVACPEFA